MTLALRHRAIYAAFDRFPSRKGSAVHIDRFARTLLQTAGGGMLYVLGGGELPPYQREGDVEVVRFSREASGRVERWREFATRLEDLIDAQRGPLQLVHFRDPWSGIPAVSAGGHRTVYEVNGLPSIELPDLHPGAPRETLARIRDLEDECLMRADAVITPSTTLADHLRRRGVTDARLHVIPNGADLPAPAPRPPQAPPRYLVYIGALQPWQGLHTLIRAFARLRDLPDLGLVICSSVHRHRAKPLLKLAEKLGVADRMIWQFELAERSLAPWREHADLSIAPLVDCPRNVQQGCAPLKILESMASGVPVVASDLPVARELMDDGVHGRLVQADRPGELARTVRVLLDYPDLLAEMGAQARARVAERFTWERSTDSLRALYGSLGLVPALGQAA